MNMNFSIYTAFKLGVLPAYIPESILYEFLMKFYPILT